MSLSSRIRDAMPQMQQLSAEPEWVPFNEWLPDLRPVDNPGFLRMLNVIPVRGSRGSIGIGPFRNFVQISNGITGTVLNGAPARDRNSNIFLYAGTKNKLWETSASTFTDVSKAGDYSTGENEYWEFEQFQNQIIATNYTDDVQSKELGQAGPFADHITGTNKPKAKHIGSVGNYFFYGNTNDSSDGIRPNRTWWSAVNNSQNVDPSASTRADYEDHPVGGAVQRIVGGLEFGILFQETRVRRIEPTSTATVFSFPSIDRARGTPIPRSVGWTGRRAFFISEDGFHFTDGSQSYPIGHGKVDETFWRIFDTTKPHLLSTTIDRLRHLIVWCVPTGFNTRRLFISNYYENPMRFTEAEAEISTVVEYRTVSSNLDDPNAPDTILDDTTYPDLDSPFWKGGVLKFGAFDLSGNLVAQEGTPRETLLETGDKTFGMGQRRMFVNEVWPVIEGQAMTGVRVAGRDSLRQPVNYGPINLDVEGLANARANGRYLRFEITTEANVEWDFGHGFRVEGMRSGREI